MTSRDCLDRPAPSLALPGLLVLLTALLACACAGEPPASCGALGRVSSCPCPGGGQGAQECGPAGVWGACVCPGADAGAEVGGEVGADAADAVGPDLPPAEDRVPGLDVAVDGGPDAPTDVPRDTSSDLPDAPVDRQDSAPDPLLEQVTAVRVTVTAPGYEWTTARAQSCEVSSGVASVSAEYGAPEPLTLAAMGTTTGPTVMTVVGGGSDVRATMRAGAEYTTGGVRRVNVALRGEPRAGLTLDVIALGCVVR